MRVRLRFFAVLREQMGASSARAVPAGTTVGALWRSVVAERPELDAIPVRFAVNQTYVEASHRLAEDDEVAVFPPVSGGRAAPLPPPPGPRHRRGPRAGGGTRRPAPGPR